ncbi:MAG: peptidoglycan-associated lipoprotein Pal [Thermoanaerobaculia bacterium]
MKNALKNASLLLICGVVAVGVACSKKPVKTAPEVEATPMAQPTPVPTTVPKDSSFPETTPRADDMTLSQDLASLNTKGYLRDVYYEFDKADIREDQRNFLSANAEWLRKYNTVKVLIEGHCDERGTSQYNLALGDKRANAAKDYLVSLGIDGSRVETRSMGKERPFDMGHDEAAWSKNRRAHFVVTAK